MFCSKCGAQVGPNERFCQKCGTLVADFSQVPLQPAQQMPQQSKWQAQQPGFIVPPQGIRQASTPLQVPSTLREPIPPQHAAAIAQPLPVSSHNVTVAQPLPEPITANNNPPVYNSQHQYNNFFSQGHPEQQFVVQGNQGTADQSGSFNASNDVRFKDRQLPDKSKAVAIVLWIFLSFFQIHAFYLRMKKAAIIKLAALVLIIAIIIGGGTGLYGNSSINTVIAVLLVALLFLIVIWNLVDLIRIVAKPKYHFRGAWQYVPQEATAATGVPGMQQYTAMPGATETSAMIGTSGIYTTSQFSTAPRKGDGNLAGKIFGLLISIGLIIGGLSGDYVLMGTNSSVALVVAGVIFLIFDIIKIATHGKKPAQGNNEWTTQIPMQGNNEWTTQIPMQGNNEWTTQMPTPMNGERTTQMPTQDITSH